MGNTRARVVRTGYGVAFSFQLVVLRTVVEQRLDAAQTGSVVNDGLRTAETGFVTKPPGG